MIMLRRLFMYSFLVAISFGAFLIKGQEKSMQACVKDQNAGLVSQVVFDLMKLSGVESSDTTLQSIVDATQKSWLRKPGDERWDIKPQFEDKRDLFMPLFKKLRMVDEITPSKKYYDYVIICGGTASRMRARLAALKKAWESGVRFGTLVSHTSDRPRLLDPNAGETDDILLNLIGDDIPTRSGWNAPEKMPKTEDEMFEFIFDQVDIPQEVREISRIKVVAPMKPDKKGELTVRATTADCINLFIQEMDEKLLEKGGSCLVVSSNPYVGYQATVFKNHMPEQFLLEAVGPKVSSEDILIPVYLDTVARCLYEELMIEKKNKNKEVEITKTDAEVKNHA